MKMKALILVVLSIGSVWADENRITNLDYKGTYELEERCEKNPGFDYKYTPSYDLTRDERHQLDELSLRTPPVGTQMKIDSNLQVSFVKDTGSFGLSDAIENTVVELKKYQPVSRGIDEVTYGVLKFDDLTVSGELTLKKEQYSSHLFVKVQFDPSFTFPKGATYKCVFVAKN